MDEENKPREKKEIDFTTEDLEKRFQAQLKIVAERNRLTAEKKKKKKKRK